ncbi:MAG TPA: M3 family metallopeptidase [Stellaceae bacterium]|nr:M3 family metallopeptidase [Stellaceae bacterium]
MTDNPFFETWKTPWGLPPFDRIRPEHFPPAFERAMAEEKAAVWAIAQNPQTPDFANTVAALEKSSRLLERVGAVFFNLEGSQSSDEIEEIARDLAPKLARHRMAIALDEKLFARLDALFRRREELGLMPDELRLLERRHSGLVRAGVQLGPEQKTRMAAIAERLASLETQFGQNVLYDESEFALVLDERDLDGLPDFARAAAAEAARERGHEGRYAVTLSRSAVEPFLTFSKRRDLRRLIYEAWTRRGAHAGEHDNRGLIPEILGLRAEKARLLGFASYAGYRLDDTMAKTPEAAERLLAQVWEPAKGKAAAERAELESLARDEGLNEPVMPWDWRYYAEKVRQRRYDLDEAALKPYFALDNIVEAAFDTAQRLFGLSFEERKDLALYHPDVRAFEVRDGSGRPVGLFLRDDFARAKKHSGAWMSSYRDQESFAGEVLPIVVNNNNFAKGSPTLLSFDDARTLFHEFGHGLHGLLSRVRFPTQSGTAVKRDFVEFPSQLLEHWIAHPHVLRRWARHCSTGMPLPEEVIERLQQARTFNQGFATVEYTAAALIDMELHKRQLGEGFDVEAFEREFLAHIQMPAAIDLRHRPPHFQHLFSGEGYAAGYYAYLWAEVIETDGFAAFTEKGDIFDPDLARRLERVLSAGDTEDPMALYREFRGRDPEIGPLLAERGLL